MSVSKIKATVFSQEQLASDVFSMWLEVGSIASEAKPGELCTVLLVMVQKNSQDAKQEIHWRLWGPLAMVIH